MKNENIFLTITVCICCIFCTNHVHAQKPKIAIVPLADSTLVCFEKKRFDNNVYLVDVEIPIVQYIIESITNRTDQDYETGICMPPENISAIVKNNCKMTIGKDILKWANEQREYDYFIFLKNNTVSTQLGGHARIPVPENSSGIVKEDNGHSLFTTIGLLVYETSRSNFLPCFDYFDKYFYNLRKVKLPEDEYSYSPEITEKLKTNFRAFMDQRVEYILSETIYMTKEDEAYTNTEFIHTGY